MLMLMLMLMFMLMFMFMFDVDVHVHVHVHVDVHVDVHVHVHVHVKMMCKDDRMSVVGSWMTACRLLVQNLYHFFSYMKYTFSNKKKVEKKKWFQ